MKPTRSLLKDLNIVSTSPTIKVMRTVQVVNGWPYYSGFTHFTHCTQGLEKHLRSKFVHAAQIVCTIGMTKHELQNHNCGIGTMIITFIDLPVPLEGVER